MKSRILIAVVVMLAMPVLAGLPGCGPTAASQYPHYAKEHDPRKFAYVIGAGDTLNINVWKDEELSTEARVRPDGTITMPLVGEMVAVGKTPQELRDEIKAKVGKYVKDAIVTVAVAEVNSYRFTVTGEVAQPGVFTSKDYLTVAEAISLAGGPSRYASPDEIVIIRRDSDDSRRRIPIDYEAILEGDAPEQDIVVLSGDTIYVP